MTTTTKTTVVACTLNSRLLSGHLGVITVGDFFSPSTVVRWVCNSRDPVFCTRVLFAMCLEKSKHNCLIVTREFFFKFLYRHKTCPYSSTAVVVLIFRILKILYIVVGVGEYMDAAVNIGSSPVSKHQIQPECGE